MKIQDIKGSVRDSFLKEDVERLLSIEEKIPSKVLKKLKVEHPLWVLACYPEYVREVEFAYLKSLVEATSPRSKQFPEKEYTIALNIAAFYGNDSMIPLLIKRGKRFNCDITNTPFDNYSPLMHAVLAGRERTVGCLLKYGSAIAIDEAVRYIILYDDYYTNPENNNEKILDRLLKYAKKKNIDIANHREQGQNSFVTDSTVGLHCKYYKETFTHRAIAENSRFLQKLLGADGGTTLTDDRGWQGVHYLSEVWITDISKKQFHANLQLLCKKEIDLNAKTEDGDTVLHLLAETIAIASMDSIVYASAKKCFSALVEKGADVTIKNNHGHTPFEAIMHYYVPDQTKSLRNFQKDLCDSFPKDFEAIRAAFAQFVRSQVGQQASVRQLPKVDSSVRNMAKRFEQGVTPQDVKEQVSSSRQITNTSSVAALRRRFENSDNNGMNR